jgi:hypothetical protein
MVLALTQWGWAGLVVAGVAIFAFWARHAWRTAVRQELVDYLERAAPEITVVDVRVACLICKGPVPGTGERRLALEPVYRDLGALPDRSAEAEAARLAIFAAVADAARADATAASRPDRDALRRVS